MGVPVHVPRRSKEVRGQLVRLSSTPSYGPIALLRGNTHFTGGGCSLAHKFPFLAPLSALAPFHQPSPRVSTKQAFWRSLDNNQFPTPPPHSFPLVLVPGDFFLLGPILSWLTFFPCGCWFLVSIPVLIYLPDPQPH